VEAEWRHHVFAYIFDEPPVISRLTAAHVEVPVDLQEQGGVLQALADVLCEGELPPLPCIADPLVHGG